MSNGVDGLKKHRMSLIVVMGMIFSMACGGPYGAENVVSTLGAGLAVAMLLIFPFFWSIPQGLIAAELGSAIPEEGGSIIWVKRGLGEFWCYQHAWWRTVSCYVDNTLYIVLATGYLGALISFSDIQMYLLQAGLIIFFTVINIRGINDVGRLTTGISLFVIVTVLSFAALGFANYNQNPFIPFFAEGQGAFSSIGLAIAICVWLYSGYESMSQMAEEMENPQIIPKAVLLSMPLIIAVYTLPVIAGMAFYGDWANWSPDTGVNYVTIAAEFGIPGFALFITCGALACNLGLYNSYLASGSRGFFVMADDNLFPRVMCKVNKKYGTPHIAIISMAAVNLVLVRFGFATLVVVDVIMFVASYLVWFFAAVALRYKEPDLPRPFTIPGGNKFLILILLCPVIIGFSTFFINGLNYMIGGILGVLTGPVSYVIIKAKYGGLDGNKKLSQIVKFDKVSITALTLAAVVVLALGMNMYQGSKASAREDINALHESYYTRYFDMEDANYVISEDSFVSYWTLKSDEETTVEVWHYSNFLWGHSVSGYVWLPAEYDYDVTFAAAVYDILKVLQNTPEGLPLDYIEFEDEAGWYFYAEYGEQYGSVAEIVDAME